MSPNAASIDDMQMSQNAASIDEQHFARIDDQQGCYGGQESYAKLTTNKGATGPRKAMRN